MFYSVCGHNRLSFVAKSIFIRSCVRPHYVVNCYCCRAVCCSGNELC